MAIGKLTFEAHKRIALERHELLLAEQLSDEIAARRGRIGRAGPSYALKRKARPAYAHDVRALVYVLPRGSVAWMLLGRYMGAR